LRPHAFVSTLQTVAYHIIKVRLATYAEGMEMFMISGVPVN